MMMVDNVVALLRPQHDWYHVMADERANLLRLLLLQAFAFFLDLAHADSDLGGTQAFNRDRLQNRLAHVSHGVPPRNRSLASNHHRSSQSHPSIGQCLSPARVAVNEGIRTSGADRSAIEASIITRALWRERTANDVRRLQ